MATPAEEIARQHEQARSLLGLTATSATSIIMACAAPHSHEEIPLTMKTKPTQEIFACTSTTSSRDTDNQEHDHEEKQEHPPCCPSPEELPTIISWSSRGRVDVSQLQDLVREGYRIAEHTPPQPAQPVQSQPAQSSSKTTTAAATTKTTQTKPTSTKTTTTQTPTKQQQPLHRATKKYTPDQIQSVTNLWDPINASIHNVNIVRPSHDAWGIGKIVLVFADDFLHSLYDLPWWHSRQDVRQAVQPILDCLQISPDRIVRLLLASLPPGTTIPLHHDTGVWVQHTHRVHVPILVTQPDEILFCVGRTNERLERIDCTPGHVFEMNNQCRHAVSNCSDDYRVHLILDYTDAVPSQPRILLQPGERLLQTRRSVDRLVDQGRRPTPSFMILGAQKAGTTSLYELMMQHPLIVRPKRRETHCLDWRWKENLMGQPPASKQNGQQNGKNTQPKKTYTTEQLRQHCHLFYEEAALRLHPSCCTGDSTPSYLLDSRRVIPNLQRVFSWPIHFLVTTRNPLARAESHFAMVTSPHGTPAQLKTRGTEWRNQTFQQVVHQELQDMQACGLIPYWNTTTGVCDQAVFDAFINTVEENQAWTTYLERHVPLNTGSYGILARGLYALNLRPWLQAFDPRQFLVLSLETDLAEDRVRATMERVFEHVGVPSSFELPDVAPQNTRDYEPTMDAALFQYLQRFFAPHEERFQDMLATLS